MTEVPSPPPDEDVLAASGSAAVATSPAGGYPVQVEADLLPEYSRFMPLIKWFLLIPQYIVLVFLGIGALFVIMIAFFAILFTGTFPKGMWDYLVGVHRWALRVMAYHLLVSDKYPPYSMDEQPGDTVRLHAAYPETVERWRPFVAWLLVIPYMFVASLIGMVASICSFIAFFTIIFTKKIPDGLFDVIRISFVWQIRAGFYNSWMSTEYPPFEWDEE
ncbi:MAG: DUF4389 domain-containing protein [Thermoleophilia bacterium]|nr:DUF4389 domain-containing protein [Thermoleophilia bacterium]